MLRLIIAFLIGRWTVDMLTMPSLPDISASPRAKSAIQELGSMLPADQRERFGAFLAYLSPAEAQELLSNFMDAAPERKNQIVQALSARITTEAPWRPSIGR